MLRCVGGGGRLAGRSGPSGDSRCLLLACRLAASQCNARYQPIREANTYCGHKRERARSATPAAPKKASTDRSGHNRGLQGSQHGSEHIKQQQSPSEGQEGAALTPSRSVASTSRSSCSARAASVGSGLPCADSSCCSVCLHGPDVGGGARRAQGPAALPALAHPGQTCSDCRHACTQAGAQVAGRPTSRPASQRCRSAAPTAGKLTLAAARCRARSAAAALAAPASAPQSG